VLEEDIHNLLDRSDSSLQKLVGQHVLMTGAGGFLGRYFIRLIEAFNQNNTGKITFTGIDNFVIGQPKQKHTIADDHISMLVGDICDNATIDPIAKPDYIISAAGIASPYYYRAMPIETLNVAVNGNQNLLKLAKRYNSRFTFFSSSEIYGNPGEGHIPTRESFNGNVSCLGPRACYDESKRLGETLAYIYSSRLGLHTNIIRPFNIYGPGMGELDYRVFPNFASCLKKGNDLQIYGDGDQTRTFCYVVDAIDGFLRVITSGVYGEPYNIGNPNPEISMYDLANLFLKLSTSKTSKLKLTDYPDSYPEDEPRRRCPDITKAVVQLGYNPNVDLEVGIQKFLTWTDSNYTK
jgi:UDP-glucuronate decarboxylase